MCFGDRVSKLAFLRRSADCFTIQPAAIPRRGGPDRRTPAHRSSGEKTCAKNPRPGRTRTEGPSRAKTKRRNAPGGRRRARGWWRRCGRSWLKSPRIHEMAMVVQRRSGESGYEPFADRSGESIKLYHKSRVSRHQRQACPAILLGGRWPRNRVSGAALHWWVRVDGVSWLRLRRHSGGFFPILANSTHGLGAARL